MGESKLEYDGKNTSVQKQKPNMEPDKEKGSTQRRTTMPKRRPLRSIPPTPRTTMRDRTGGGGSIQDLPDRLLEMQKRLQYVAQEVEKARDRGEDVTPKFESGGCLNIDGYELDLNNLSKSLNLGEGMQGLEKMLNIGGLGGLLKNILGDLDIEKLKDSMEEQSKSGGYEKSGRNKPVIKTEIKVSELGQDPRGWSGLSGSGAKTVEDRFKGTGTAGSKYQKGKQSSPYNRGSGGGIGSIDRGGLGGGHAGQKMEKKVRKTPPTMQPQEDFGLKDIVERALDYEIFPKGDTNYEIIVNDLNVEKIDTIEYNKDKNELVINEELRIPLKEYTAEKVLNWDYRNNVLTISLEK